MSYTDGVEFDYAIEKIFRFVDNERWLLLSFRTIYDVARAFIPGARMYIVPSYEKDLNYLCVYIIAPKIKQRQQRRLEKWYENIWSMTEGKEFIHLHIEEGN